MFSCSNTQERKPVTNSRDTQELLPDAGHEMLRIFLTHPARTSLLQDFAYYEVCIFSSLSLSFRLVNRFLATSYAKSARLKWRIFPTSIRFCPSVATDPARVRFYFIWV